MPILLKSVILAQYIQAMLYIVVLIIEKAKKQKDNYCRHRHRSHKSFSYVKAKVN